MTSDTARRLVEEALSLCQLGERAPGCGPWPAETWPEWARRAEEWLRAEPEREPVGDPIRAVAEALWRDADYDGDDTWANGDPMPERYELLARVAVAAGAGPAAAGRVHMEPCATPRP